MNHYPEMMQAVRRQRCVLPRRDPPLSGVLVELRRDTTGPGFVDVSVGDGVSTLGISGIDFAFRNHRSCLQLAEQIRQFGEIDRHVGGAAAEMVV